MDYLAGQRRYMPGESDADKYRYFARDHQGSVFMMTDHEQNVEEYKYDAWGEHIDATNLPSTANNIRYAGLRLECFVDSGNSADAIYETGSRHYWPRIGRFLQRDPLTYNSLPNPSKPLSLNPYIYCENNPVMAVDASGLKSTFVRGATMGNASMWLGTFRPGYLYDCCEEHFTTVPEDQRWNAYLIWHQVLGYIKLKDAAKFFHWKKFCDFDPSVAQPDKGCANTTWINPDLACTFLAECKHGSCAKPGGDIINGGGGGNGGTGGSGGGTGGGGGSCGGGGCPGKQNTPYKGGEIPDVFTGAVDGNNVDITNGSLTSYSGEEIQLLICWIKTFIDNTTCIETGLSEAGLLWNIGFIDWHINSMSSLAVTLIMQIFSGFLNDLIFHITPGMGDLDQPLVNISRESFCQKVAACYEETYTLSSYGVWIGECRRILYDIEDWQGQIPFEILDIER